MSPPIDSRSRLLAGAAAAFGASMVLHPLLGWAWTGLAGAAGGWVDPRRGWLAGTLGGGAAWGATVAWSYAVDARAVGEMTGVVGSLLGGLPPPATVLLTVALGALLGAGGGIAGSGIRNFLAPVAR